MACFPAPPPAAPLAVPARACRGDRESRRSNDLGISASAGSLRSL